jgi:HSP20 family protein
MNLGLTRWDPWRTTSLFPYPTESGAPSLLRDFFRMTPLTGWDEADTLGSNAWAPPVDISEDANQISLTAELPGFKEKDVSVELHGNVLTISGERKHESEKKDRNYTRVERSYGQFCRSFTLPTSVDRDNVKATFSDGLLKLELPKKPEAKPRQIPVGTGEKEQKSIAS